VGKSTFTPLLIAQMHMEGMQSMNVLCWAPCVWVGPPSTIAGKGGWWMCY